MKWLVKISKRSHIVDSPSSLISGVPFEIKVGEKKILASWKESTKTVCFLTQTDTGGYIEKPVSLRTIAVSQHPGDHEKEINIEISGINSENHQAKVSKHATGQENRDKAKTAKGSVIRSPITGKVLKVSVNQGDRVGKEELLLTIEAMKMENKIFSNYDGKVVKISVNDGDMVTIGTELVSIK